MSTGDEDCMVSQTAPRPMNGLIACCAVSGSPAMLGLCRRAPAQAASWSWIAIVTFIQK